MTAAISEPPDTALVQHLRAALSQAVAEGKREVAKQLTAMICAEMRVPGQGRPATRRSS